MSTTTLTQTQLEAENLIQAITNRHQCVTTDNSVHFPALADILPFTAPLPRLEVNPTTRIIGPTGRVRLMIQGVVVSTVLGWRTTNLRVEISGSWLVLHQDSSGRTTHKNDGHCSVTPDGRIRLTKAACKTIGLAFGDEALFLPIPEKGILAITHPSRILTGAPLFPESR